MQIWGIGYRPLASWELVGLLLASVVTLPLFALIALTFIPIGQLVGFYLESAPRGITAYTINVLASLFGIALYTGLCFLNQPPLVWFIVALIIATALFWSLRGPRTIVAASLAICIVVIAWGASTEPGRTYWSPYQKLNIE